jgi:hypothetical protein
VNVRGDASFFGPVAARDQYFIDSERTEERDYLAQVADVHRRWTNEYIIGSASAIASPFVPPDTATVPGPEELYSLIARPGPAHVGRGSRRPIDILSAINLHRRVLLLGRPGSGKTSYLQYVSLRFTDPQESRDLLPVLVDLSAYGGTEPFLEFIKSFLNEAPNPEPPEEPIYVTSPWMAGTMEEYLGEGRVLLLLDALNQAPPGVAARLADFFAGHPKARAVVTCRLLDYNDELNGAGFQSVIIDPWTVDQMKLYLSKSRELNLEYDAAQGIEQNGYDLLLQRLEERNPFLLSLGEVPFLLRTVTVLTRNSSDRTLQFLNSESTLIKEFVDFLLYWARQVDRENATLFPTGKVEEALSHLAAAMHAAGFRGTAVEEGWARKCLTMPPANLDDPERLIEFGCGATILDKPLTRKTVRFWHLTHQNYFAALRMRAHAGGEQNGAAAPAPMNPGNDQLNSMALTAAEDLAGAVEAVLQSGDPRAPMVAAQALLAGEGGQ